MTNNCLKSEKGVTLLTLTIYIIVLTAIVGIMAGVSSLFYNNIGMMKDAIENAGDFDTLNSCLISDSKSNSAVVVDETAKTIKFEMEQNINTMKQKNAYIEENLKLLRMFNIFL